VLVPTA
ncbi:hypothetical protein EC880221_4682, partial [Escherichia coli 88.0221]